MVIMCNITVLLMWLARRTVVGRAQRQRIRIGETVSAATCGLRGSPFQLPTRLADGLGPGSDLGHGYPRPCAPSPELLPGNLDPPHWPSGRKANLGCLHFHNAPIVCGRGKVKSGWK